MLIAQLLRPAAPRPLRLLGPAVGGLALTAGAGLGPAAAAATPAAHPAATLAAAPHPAVTSIKGTPVAVSTLSTTDAWAVEGSNVVLHWNGTAWAQTKLPQYGTGSYLEAANAVSVKDVWAAGYYNTSSSQCHPLLEHWNGSTWTRVPSPAPTRPAGARATGAVVTAAEVTGAGPSGGALSGTFLQGVSGTSASSAWAVGYDQVASGGVFSVSVILRWDGTSWTRVPSPDPGGGTNVYLNAVTSLSATNAWAVGYYTTATTTRALTAHWNGKAWKVVSNPASGDPDLLGVSAASPSDIWAVGYQGDNTLALHWNGTSWAQVTSPSPGYFGNALTAVTTVSPSLAWAVGSYDVFKESGVIPVKTLLLQWNGSAWTQVATPNPARVAALSGVDANSASSAWAVGSYQVKASGGTIADKTLMLRRNGTAWTRA